MIVYKVTNKINGKCYIGQTTCTLQIRKNAHLHPKTKHKFHHAINKYGSDNFSWDVLCECNSIDELNKKEIYYINKYDSIKNGYNIREGGKNGKDSPETIKKRSKFMKAWYKTPEGLAKIKRATEREYKPISEETKAILSRALKECNKDPVYKKKIRKLAKKRAETLKTGKDIICLVCQKSFYVPGWMIRKYNGKPILCSFKCKVKSVTGKPFSEERKAGLRKGWLHRKQYGLYKDPEKTRKKLSESVRKSWIKRRKGGYN